MRILVVASALPWPTQYGGQIRTRALIEALARKNEVVLSVPVQHGSSQELPSDAAACVSQFVPVPAEAATWVSFPFPGKTRVGRLINYSKDVINQRDPLRFRLANNLWAQALRSVLPTIDAALCRFMPAMGAIDGFPLNRTIVDADDLSFMTEWRLAKAAGWRLRGAIHAVEAWRCLRRERSAYRDVAQVLVASETDARRLPKARLTIVKNGFHIRDRASSASTRRNTTIAFVGNFEYPPNFQGLQWFLSEVWPDVADRSPGAQLVLAGIGATPHYLPFAVRPNIKLLGWVDDIQAIFGNVVATVAPLLFGVGTRLKIIESLALKTPVISTSIGAEGLDDFKEQHGLFRRDRAIQMTDTLVALLKEPEAFLAAAALGSKVALDQYSWDHTTAPLVENLEGWLDAN